MKSAWDTAREQRPGEHMTALASSNGGAPTMVMKAAFQLQVVWDSIAFCVKRGCVVISRGAPQHSKKLDREGSSCTYPIVTLLVDLPLFSILS